VSFTDALISARLLESYIYTVPLHVCPAGTIALFYIHDSISKIYLLACGMIQIAALCAYLQQPTPPSNHVSSAQLIFFSARAGSTNRYAGIKLQLSIFFNEHGRKSEQILQLEVDTRYEKNISGLLKRIYVSSLTVTVLLPISLRIILLPIPSAFVYLFTRRDRGSNLEK
jgi:hypothetical protein